MSRTRSPHPRLWVEELEARLTPAEVGLNDFRISFMGPDGNPDFYAFTPAVAYNSRDNEYLVVWEGNDTGDGTEVFGQRVSAATGALLGGEIKISDAEFTASNPRVAYNSANNEYLVVWYGDDLAVTPPIPIAQREKEIFGQRLNAATGALLGGEIRICEMGSPNNLDFEALDPAVAYNSANNEYLVVWRGHAH